MFITALPTIAQMVGTNRILRIPVAGGGKEVLEVDAGHPIGVALSNEAVYWRENTDGGSRIWRQAR